jgi:hypothetical protein
LRRAVRRVPSSGQLCPTFIGPVSNVGQLLAELSVLLAELLYLLSQRVDSRHEGVVIGVRRDSSSHRLPPSERPVASLSPATTAVTSPSTAWPHHGQNDDSPWGTDNE